MAVLKSAFQAAWDRYLKGVSKTKFNDVLANAAITETQFYARERLAKNLLESRRARSSSRFGHKGIIKGNPVGLMTTASIPTSIGINKSDAILQHKMARVAHSLPPINFFPPAVIQSKAPLLKALRGMFHDAPSGVLDTDQIASDNILEEKLKRLDRIRAFGRATQASGFSRYAKAEAQANKDVDERNEYERERAENARLAESRGSIRNRKERLMLLREFPTFFRNSKMSTKDMRDMAKSLRAIRKIPIVGRIATNPIGAAGAILGAQKMVFNTSDAANKEVVDWQNLALMTGGLSKEFENAGYLAGMKSPGEIMGSLGKFQQMYGPAAVDMLRGYGSSLATAPAETRQMLASRFGLNTKEAALAMALSNPELFASGQRITQAARNKISAMETMGYSTGSSLSDTINSIWLSVMGGAQARDVSGNTDWSKKIRKSMEGDYAEMMDRLVYTWNEVHDTAEIDDRYRAGMYDNSVTNNDASRSVSLQVNVASPQITTTGDPVDFAKGIANIGSRALSEYQSVIENTDTKRTN